MASKTFPTTVTGWTSTFQILSAQNKAGTQVDIQESSLKDGITDHSWIVVDKGEQLDWLIEELQRIQKED